MQWPTCFALTFRKHLVVQSFGNSMWFSPLEFIILQVIENVAGQFVPTGRIPSEVLRRFGGLSDKQKRDLYRQYQSFAFVNIPVFLKTQIQSIESLYKFGVCKTQPTATNIAEPYFVCPSVQPSPTVPFEEQLRYCCGAVEQQYCCSSSAFISGIRTVTSDLVISPSIVMGISLGFLSLCTLVAILAYTKIARNLRRQSTKLQHYSASGPNLGTTYGSKSTFSSYHVPPRNQLLSGYQENKIPKNEPVSVEYMKLNVLNNADKKAIEVLKRKQSGSPASKSKITPTKSEVISSPNNYVIHARPSKRYNN